MMLESKLENAIVEAVADLGLEGLNVVGAWQTVADGAVKGRESPDDAAVLAVAVAPRSFVTFGFCEVELAVAMALSVRVDADPTGEKLVEYAAAVSELIQGWNLVEAGDELTDLAVEGFDPGGVQVTGGDGPTLENGVWSVVQNLTVRGTVSHAGHE